MNWCFKKKPASVGLLAFTPSVIFEADYGQMSGCSAIAGQVYLDPGDKEQIKNLVKERGQVTGYECRNAGMNDYLAKPVQMQDLVQKLEGLGILGQTSL